MSPWGRRQEYELPRVDQKPMRTPPSEHRNLECSARALRVDKAVVIMSCFCFCGKTQIG